MDFDFKKFEVVFNQCLLYLKRCYNTSMLFYFSAASNATSLLCSPQPVATASATCPPSSTSKHRLYCMVCRNYDGKILENGQRLSLHRIPNGASVEKKELRKQWISTLKMMRQDFPKVLTDNHRVCDLHFEGPYKLGSVPKISAGKIDKKPRRILIRAETCSETSSLTMSNVENVDNVDALDENDLEVPQDSPAKSQLNSTTEYREIGIQVGSPFSAKYSNVGTQAKTSVLRPEDLKGNDEKTRFYTGFVSFSMFMFIFGLYEKHGASKLNYWQGERSMKEKPYHQGNVNKTGKQRTLRPIDEFLMMCMKLRLNLLHEHLGDLFHVSTSTVSRTLNTWINFVFDHSKSLVTWPTQEKIMQCLPLSFANYPYCNIILDCTEIFIEKPSSLTAQWLTWSEYKHHNTVKVLIGVTPQGMVNFISTLWGGRASDRHITQNDGLIPQLHPNTTLMADKGFTVEDLLPPDVGMNVPPRIPGHRQMTDKEVF